MNWDKKKRVVKCNVHFLHWHWVLQLFKFMTTATQCMHTYITATFRNSEIKKKTKRVTLNYFELSGINFYLLLERATFAGSIVFNHPNAVNSSKTSCNSQWVLVLGSFCQKDRSIWIRTIVGHKTLVHVFIMHTSHSSLLHMCMCVHGCFFLFLDSLFSTDFHKF